jgi:hypothetical protein
MSSPPCRYQDRPRTRSGLKGVIYHPHTTKKPWKAYGRHQGWYVTIGYYSSKHEAAIAYNRWALKTHGRNAYLNPLFSATLTTV